MKVIDPCFSNLKRSTITSRWWATAAVVALLAHAATHEMSGEPIGPAPTGKTVVLDMPFDFSSGVILLEMDFGDAHPRKLIFDTGNDRSMLDSVVAKELGLPAPAPSGNNPPSPYYKAVVPSCRLGGEFFGDFPVIVGSFSKQVADDYHIHCDGSIGYGFFRNRIVQIDYPARRFRLLAQVPASHSGATTAISWRKYWSKSPDLVTVENLVVSERKVCAQIDTFLAQSAILFPTKLPGLKTEPAAGVAAIQYEDAKLDAVQLDGGLTLGGCSTNDKTPVFLAGAKAHVPETEIAAVLGNAFFQQTVLTFDFPSSRLIVDSPTK